jgi:uncharacterized protein YndB with AHSA1/START domain
MDKQFRDAEANIVVAPPPERVWKALTDPADVKEYFLGTHVTSSWREGDPVTFEGEWQGKSYQDKGTVLEARPNELLRITHYSPLSGLPDEPGNYHTVEYGLEAVAEGTRVSIIQGNNRSDDEAAESEKLWSTVLGNLKGYLEG